MTTTTHTAAAMLSVAVAALEAQNKAHKSETGEALYSLGTDIGNGITFRELKSWAKDFKAKQAEVAPKAAAAKPAAKVSAAKTPAAKPAAEVVTLKSTEVRDHAVLIGRKAETVVRVVKDKESGESVAVTDKATRILLADIERNNRGNLRVKADAVSKYDAKAPVAPAPKVAAAKPAAKTPAAKPAAKKPAADEFEAESSNVRKFPIRHLEISKSSNLVSADYDRNTQTLIVTFKDGAVWNYEGVKLSEARALETAESSGKHFIAHIRDVKTGKMAKGGAKPAATEKAAAAKPAAKTPAPKAAAKTAVKAEAVEFTGNDLRHAVFMNGRKAETIAKVVKGTDGARYIVTEEGTRVAVSSLRKNNRGKFVADEVAPAAKPAKPAAKVAAAKPAENARKTTGNKKPDFAKSEAAKTRVVEPRPTINDVRENGVRVVKGAKSVIVPIERVVRRENVRYAITENRFPLPFDQIISLDGQLTYTGKPLTAEEFRAL